MNRRVIDPRLAARRRLLLGLRKKVHVQRRFKVEHLGAGRIRWTCLTCGHAHYDKYNVELADKWVRYVMHPDGKGTAGGECERCTEKARDERYPL